MPALISAALVRREQDFDHSLRHASRLSAVLSRNGLFKDAIAAEVANRHPRESLECMVMMRHRRIKMYVCTGIQSCRQRR